MANKKISALTALGGTPAVGDILPITDVSDTTGSPQGTTKRVTVANLVAAAPQGDLVSTNNLSDLTNAVTARTNLGLGTAATSASTDFSSAFFSTVTEATTSRTLSDSDNGKVIVCTNSSDITVTIPNTLTAGFGCTLVQSGTGQVQATAGSGTTLNAYGGTATTARYAAINIIPIATATYVIDGDASFPPGAFDSNIYASRLDGTDDHFTTGATFESMFQSSFSMSFWAKLDASATGLRFLGSSAVAGNNRWQVYHDGSKIVSFIESNNVNGDTLATSTTPTFTDWFNLVLTYEQSGSSLIQKSYVNGALEDSGTTTTDLSAFTQSTNLVIGLRQGGQYPWYGDMDEVAFFNTALSSSQVSNIYKGESNGGSGGTNGKPGDLTTFNPLHWWRMGDSDSASGGGSAGTITDLGGAVTTVDLAGSGPLFHDLSTAPDSIYVAP
jgi:hypothetical protein